MQKESSRTYPTLKKIIKKNNFSLIVVNVHSRMKKQTETHSASASTFISPPWFVVKLLCLYGNRKGMVCWCSGVDCWERKQLLFEMIFQWKLFILFCNLKIARKVDGTNCCGILRSRGKIVENRLLSRNQRKRKVFPAVL